MTRYPEERLDPEYDDGTILANVEALGEAVIGRRIVSADQTSRTDRWGYEYRTFVLTLDDGTEVRLADTDDCCAYTALEGFFLDPSSVDHVILGVGTTEEATVWHVYADFGDVMRLDVGWSCGNPFYYGYGFDLEVVPNEEEATS